MDQRTCLYFTDHFVGGTGTMPLCHLLHNTRPVPKRRMLTVMGHEGCGGHDRCNFDDRRQCPYFVADPNTEPSKAA